MIPGDRVYTKEHQWVREQAAFVEIGVTDPLLQKLSPLISIELPDPDDEMKLELPFGELEGLNETYQLYPPLEANIIEVNAELVWNHRKLLDDPYGEGWLLKIRAEDRGPLKPLLNANTYRVFCLETLGQEFLND